MAITQQALGFASGLNLFQDTANTNSAKTVKGSAGTLFSLYLNNTPNVAITYVQMFDSAGAISLGSTAPDWVFKIPASTALMIQLANGTVSTNIVAAGGIAFASGLQVACTTTANGSTGVGTALTIQIIYT